ncbi:hypothetical protein M431DRAFT_462215 [Trichoderma harzianum CBS 226.95]|uniref:Uncharacterized protein n=1 Tax=Trichoderma harzianum CBS 226.95 TaxID=983964 RepID=A0A2T4A8L5_TRIHA|nr:hypothetical protein M431DRAFT_462215 [Trichoderma harzianum CBS 226.95]PTB53424.1 hypothetical protein M431DRAFT_462215 [Trichoderma harzianum CBS 226.95]
MTEPVPGKTLLAHGSLVCQIHRRFKPDRAKSAPRPNTLRDQFQPGCRYLLIITYKLHRQLPQSWHSCFPQGEDWHGINTCAMTSTMGSKSMGRGGAWFQSGLVLPVWTEARTALQTSLSLALCLSASSVPASSTPAGIARPIGGSRCHGCLSSPRPFKPLCRIFEYGELGELGKHGAPAFWMGSFFH